MSRQVVILIYIKTWRKDSKELGEKSQTTRYGSGCHSIQSFLTCIAFSCILLKSEREGIGQTFGNHTLSPDGYAVRALK